MGLSRKIQLYLFLLCSQLYLTRGDWPLEFDHSAVVEKNLIIIQIILAWFAFMWLFRWVSNWLLPIKQANFTSTPFWNKVYIFLIIWSILPLTINNQPSIGLASFISDHYAPFCPWLEKRNNRGKRLKMTWEKCFPLLTVIVEIEGTFIF